MPRIRQFLSTSVAALLLLAVAGPVAAKPAPFDNGSGDGRPGTSVDSGTSIWTYTGYALAVLLAVALVAAVAIALDRHHSHHAPHPA